VLWKEDPRAELRALQERTSPARQKQLLKRWLLWFGQKTEFLDLLAMYTRTNVTRGIDTTLNSNESQMWTSSEGEVLRRLVRY
jgi:hypothetical protein